MEKFKTFKEEIIKRSKSVNACELQFKRAVSAENFTELITVITDNFNYCCNNKIIDTELLETIGQEICNENNLFFNVSTDRGFLIASGSSTVMAYDSSYINSYNTIEHKVSDKVILRYYYENRLVFGENIKL